MKILSILAAIAVIVGGWAWGQCQAGASVNGPFSDDFNGAAYSQPDGWSYDTGGGGWGNSEIQTYTNDPANVRLDGEGNLVIDAVRDADGNFTSARLTTKDMYSFTSGRAEARIKVPSGDGVHPAFWLLGTDGPEVGWPKSGEIDVVETINDATAYNCALHGPTVDGGHWQVGESELQSEPLSTQFHNYWVERSPGSISFGVDGDVRCTFSAESVGPENLWIFDKPFYLLLNVAIGGSYPGPVSAQTPSTSEMLVDWVRVTPS